MEVSCFSQLIVIVLCFTLKLSLIAAHVAHGIHSVFISRSTVVSFSPSRPEWELRICLHHNVINILLWMRNCNRAKDHGVSANKIKSSACYPVWARNFKQMHEMILFLDHIWKSNMPQSKNKVTINLYRNMQFLKCKATIFINLME